MTLSDIKFNYQEKIDKVNARIERYQKIIGDYNVRIRIAEKEDNPNISSVIKSKKQYEHKIQNMGCVKEYYQEFIDTADYLMQNLNNEESFQLISKNEQLIKQNETLKEEIMELEQLLEDKTKELQMQEIQNSVNNKKLKRLRENKKLALNKVKEENKLLKDKNKSVKQLKSDNKKLSAKNQMLLDTNEFLENKCANLQEYCNDLLNRTPEQYLENDSLLQEQYAKLVNG